MTVLRFRPSRDLARLLARCGIARKRIGRALTWAMLPPDLRALHDENARAVRNLRRDLDDRDEQQG